jgi:hypothetical protein
MWKRLRAAHRRQLIACFLILLLLVPTAWYVLLLFRGPNSEADFTAARLCKLTKTAPQATFQQYGGQSISVSGTVSRICTNCWPAPDGKTRVVVLDCGADGAVECCFAEPTQDQIRFWAPGQHVIVRGRLTACVHPWTILDTCEAEWAGAPAVFSWIGALFQ